MKTNYNEIKGDLIELAQQGEFDVIAHGCNCFCTMGAGIAPQMAKAFHCDTYPLELQHPGNINKLGTIDYQEVILTAQASPHKSFIYVVNAYTQYNYGRNHSDGYLTPIDYEALTLCMRKMNHRFIGRRIGLPQIGAGLAGGDWERIKSIIQNEFTDCQVTVVIYNK